MTSDKEIIATLVQIAEKQQEALEKLTKALEKKTTHKRRGLLERIATMRDTGSNPGAHPANNKVYEFLMHAIPAVAKALGINNVVVSKIDTQPAQTNGNVRMDETHAATIVGIPPKMGDEFKKAWDKQLATQKPDLVGRVSFFLQ